jgi:hypothetical protein
MPLRVEESERGPCREVKAVQLDSEASNLPRAACAWRFGLQPSQAPGAGDRPHSVRQFAKTYL